MTARTYLLCGLLLPVFSCNRIDRSAIPAVEREIDSLYNKSASLYDSYPDSALAVGRKVVEKARSIRDSGRVGKGLTNIAYAHYIKGNYPESLDTFQRALDIDNECKLEKSKAAHNNNISNIYKSLENYDTALRWYLAADSLARRAQWQVIAARKADTVSLKTYDTVLCNAAMNIGYVYEKKAGENQLVRQILQRYTGMAFSYEYAALNLSITIPHRKNLNVIFNNLGKIHRLNGNTDSARYYFRRAIDSSFSVHDTRGRGESHIFLAELYNGLNLYDSAIANGDAALTEVSASSYLRGKLMAFSVLAHAFEKISATDSAFYYLKKKDETYRRIFSITNVQQMQFSAIEHSNMEIRRVNEKEEEAKKYNDNLNRYLVTFFVFFGLVFLVFKIWKKARSRWLGIAGAVIILMSFELLNEFIHSGIEHLLEKSSWPIFNKGVFAWFFLITVVLAIFFNLLHHWLEHWIKSKFSVDKKDEGKD